MKLSTILILIVIAYTSYPSAQTRQVVVASTVQTSAEDEINNLEETRNQAVLHGAVTALDRMTSDDYTIITLKSRAAHQIRHSERVCIRIVPLRIAANF
jgi:hypothetical protein